jgi:D-cysteine desulfhydrase
MGSAAVTPVRLGVWPTPLEPAPRLAAAVGLDELWLKRDDLGGLGGGGNKVRKLEYACAQALEAGATTLVTTGAAQSNHARLTAAAAARLGLGAVLVLAGTPPDAARGNVLLDRLAGADVVWAGDVSPAGLGEELGRQAAAVRAGGGVPFVIPLGGSTPVAAQGYLECAAELSAQLPGLDTVVVALGSGGTMAGLVAGLGPDRVLGVDVGALADPRATVAALVAAMPGPSVAPGVLRIDGDQVGDGYEALTPAVREALVLAARTEGVFLDPTYTGRALAGLVAAVSAGRIARTERTVLLHSGGLPGLFGHPALPGSL